MSCYFVQENPSQLGRVGMEAWSGLGGGCEAKAGWGDWGRHGVEGEDGWEAWWGDAGQRTRQSHPSASQRSTSNHPKTLTRSDDFANKNNGH